MQKVKHINHVTNRQTDRQTDRQRGKHRRVMHGHCSPVSSTEVDHIGCARGMYCIYLHSS